MARRLVRCYPTSKLPDAMNDTPNFAAWSNENLAKFALDAYLRLQAQQDAIEQLRGDLKDAMQLVRQIQRPDA